MAHLDHVVKSPLRYPGGKSKALSQILPLIPDFSEFREPMGGGGAVFIRLKQMYPDRLFWINDINYELYCFWKTLQDQPNELIDKVRRVKEQTVDGKSLFYELLSQYGTGPMLERAARFFILNRISFSGTVDSGGYSEQAFKGRFTHSSIESLARLAPILTGVEITNLDYEEVLCAPGKEVLLFLDPPYYSATQSRLYGKRGELHLQFDHERLAKRLKLCAHQWLITYDDSEKIRCLYSDTYLLEWTLQYGMTNYKQPTARPGKELFIANYDIRPLHQQQMAFIMEHRG